MNNAILIQHAYPNKGFEPMLELTRAHNEKYCKRFGFDLLIDNSEDNNHVWLSGAWKKIELIQDAMQKGYQYIFWLDADAMIIDVSVDARQAFQTSKIGACWHRIPQLDHWNVGVLYVENSADTMDFINKWLASYPPPADGWFEQGIFNRMGRAGKTVVTLSDKWNATIGVNMVPDAVVLGFHGQGDAATRYEMMKETFCNLFPDEKAKAQG